MRRTLILGLRLALASVYALGAYAKAVHLPEFSAMVEAYGLVPRSLVPTVAAATLALETGLAMALLAGWWVRRAALLSAALLVCFLAVGVAAFLRGAQVDCGCFPGLLRQDLGPAFFQRDGGLLFLTLLLAALASAPSLPSAPDIEKP